MPSPDSRSPRSASGATRASMPKEAEAGVQARDRLTLLVLLQDLDGMIREATDPKQTEAVNRMGFRVEGVEGLRTAREEVAAQLDRRTLRQYEAVAQRYGGRAVAPVRNRTCLACSALQPTGRTPDSSQVTACQTCGRILYPL
jgi:RNase P subunit RPR2